MSWQPELLKIKLFATYNAIPAIWIGSPPITSENDFKQHANAVESILSVLNYVLNCLFPVNTYPGGYDMISAHYI